MNFKLGFWSDREYHLDKMNLSQLVLAYFQYYAIAAYLFVAFMLSLYVIFSYSYNGASIFELSISVFSTIIIYPLVWYVLHRWVLHSKWMWKSKICFLQSIQRQSSIYLPSNTKWPFQESWISREARCSWIKACCFYCSDQ